MKKISLLIVMLFVVGLFATVAVGCDDGNKEPDYTIIVMGLDGKPSVGTNVQVCKVGSDGSTGFCYAFIKTTDNEGKVTLNIKADGMDAESDAIEVHLQGLPPYYSYTDSRMMKGETKTINIIEHISTPTGKGTAEYVVENEEPTNKIDTAAESFSPYHMEYDAVHTGAAYGIKFEKADQKIYIEYYTVLEYDYKIYSISGVELKITELSGNVENGIVKDGDDKHTATGKELNYVFAAKTEHEGGYVSYFELELVNAEDVGKDITLCFETVRKQ